MSTLSITIIQTNLHWEDKTLTSNAGTEDQRHKDKTEILVLPEIFSTGFSMKPKTLAETIE